MKGYNHGVLSALGGESGFSISLANEICDRAIGRGQCLLIRQKHDAEMLRAGFLAKS